MPLPMPLPCGEACGGGGRRSMSKSRCRFIGCGGGCCCIAARRGNRGEAQELRTRCGGDQFDALASLPVDFAQNAAFFFSSYFTRRAHPTTSRGRVRRARFLFARVRIGTSPAGARPGKKSLSRSLPNYRNVDPHPHRSLVQRPNVREQAVEVASDVLLRSATSSS